MTPQQKRIAANMGITEDAFRAQLAANIGAPNALDTFVNGYVSPQEKRIAAAMGLSPTAMAFGKARSTETLKSLGIALRDSAPYPSRSDAVDDEDDEDDSDDGDDCDDDDELAAKRRAKKAEKALDDLIAKAAAKRKAKRKAKRAATSAAKPDELDRNAARVGLTRIGSRSTPTGTFRTYRATGCAA